MAMTEAEKLIRDLDTLAASTRNDWADLTTKHLSIDERAGIREDLDWCLTEMARLKDRIQNLP
jgi:hypothetical protein